MRHNIVLHALRLIQAGDYKQLEYLLSNVQNLKKIWRRALRLGAWRKISPLKWGLITLVANTLQQIKSRILLNSILETIQDLIPNLLLKTEKKILETSEKIMETLKNISLNITVPLEEYIFTQTIKQVTIQSIGFAIK